MNAAELVSCRKVLKGIQHMSIRDVDPSPEAITRIDHVGPFVLRMAESLLQMVRAFYRLNILLTH